MSDPPAAAAPPERPTGILDEPNEGRALEAAIDGVVYARQPVRTHLVTASRRRGGGPAALCHARCPMTPPWWPSVSGWWPSPRAARTAWSTSSRAALARFLVRFVTRPGYGIGLGTAETMQLAIDEVGAPRILLAAGVSAVSKPFGVHGLFYRVAGPQAAAIDGPTSYTIPPYNQSATLGPKDPDGAARRLAAAIGRPVAVIDANDAGCNVLGGSPGIDRSAGEAPVRRQPAGPGARADADRGGPPRGVARGPAAAAGAEAPPHASLIGLATLRCVQQRRSPDSGRHRRP